MTATRGVKLWVLVTLVTALLGAVRPGGVRAEQTQIPPAEYAALVAIYEATDGPHWTNAWELPTDHPCDLLGVWCSEGRILMLSLGNNNLSGHIPPEIGDLGALEFLELDNNALSGPIPPELASLDSLESLMLNQNQLSGPIPPELGDMASIRNIFIAANRLDGEIPPELGNLTTLAYLDLSGNQLSGVIPPELGQLTGLRVLSLHHNQLSGVVPDDLANLSELVVLALSGNPLSGPIPTWISNLTELEVLVLRGCGLTGAIPEALGDLTDLNMLDLAENHLSGPIPSSLGNLTRLYHLNLANNQLVGPIPSTLDALTGLEQLDLDYNLLWAGEDAPAGFLAHAPYWAYQQVVAPTNITATPQRGAARLTWTPPLYASSKGYYEVGVSQTPGGPYTAAVRANGWNATTATVPGLASETTYYLAVRTFIPKGGAQLNDLLSPYGGEVQVTTPFHLLIWIPAVGR